MNTPIKAVQSPYYGEGNSRTPPPDLPSLLLKERIVYLGMPLVPAVTELIIAELLFLQYEDPDKPIKIYINSTGTSGYSGEPVGFETEAFAICDTIRYIKPPVHTICLGSAMGMAAMLLAAGTKGFRASLPHASIVCTNPRRTRGVKQATFKFGLRKCWQIKQRCLIFLQAVLANRSKRLLKIWIGCCT